MESRYKFTCNKCGHKWKSKDYDEADAFRYHFGYDCPKCGSDDVSPEDDD